MGLVSAVWLSVGVVALMFVVTLTMNAVRGDYRPRRSGEVVFSTAEVTALYLAVKELAKYTREDDLGAIMHTSGSQALKDPDDIVTLCKKLRSHTRIR